MRILSLFLLLSCTGCFVHHEPAKVYFDTCGEGCDLPGHPLAAGGATSPIAVKNVYFTAVRSTDPSVATFRIDVPDRVIVTTGAPGAARLQLLDSGGKLLGEYDVVVRPTAELRVLRGWGGGDPRILAGAPQLFHVSTVAADGSDLKGDGAVEFTLDGTLALAPFVLDGDSIGFTGTPGSGTITASCPEATVTQSVTVVAPEAITGLRLTALPADKADQVAVVVGLDSADGDVYGAQCEWDVSDPSVVLMTSIPAKLQDNPLSSYVFKLKNRGRYDVTCHMAGRTGTVSVER